MTNKEMSELFLIMMHSWPNAEMFKGGIEKLAPTIRLWAMCLPEIDYWTGRQALTKLCRVCKFPPSIAEFREQAEIFNNEVENAIGSIRSRIRMTSMLDETLDEWYAELPDGDPAKIVISRMGGPQALTETHTAPDGSKTTTWNWDRLSAEYRLLLREAKALPGGFATALPAKKNPNNLLLGGEDK